MHFVFYPDHQFVCPHVRHCPHLGGAALGTLVNAAAAEKVSGTVSAARARRRHGPRGFAARLRTRAGMNVPRRQPRVYGSAPLGARVSNYLPGTIKAFG